jgi:uncharacterized protein (DUF488 family)
VKEIYTIGYEGASIEDFISILKTHRITSLLDVREIPLSRRKGFSKKALAQALESSGIEYRHERGLGSPKDIRDELHKDKNYSKFFFLFEKYLETQQELLQALGEKLDGNIVLMCYERDPNTCHRRVVATHLTNLTGCPVTHLSVAKHGNQSKKTSVYPSQSIPSTQSTI